MAARFPHGLVLWESPHCESLSHGYAVPAPFGKGAFGVHRPKPPWPLWGCLGTAEAGGFRRQSLRNFLPIPYSLFPKKPSPFHMGWYFGKVPAVESLSHGCAVPAPFGKGAFGVHRPKPPLRKGGASACRGGGIPWPKPRTSSLFPLPYSLKLPGIVTGA